MASPIPKLNALALAEIDRVTERYLKDQDVDRWERDAAKVIARAHQAGYLLGLSERLGVPVDSPLLNNRNLSRAEREELKLIVQTQLNFLSRFADVVGDLSDSQVLARAQLYALAPKQTYWTGWAGEPLDCVPGGCEECYGNCRCTLRRESNGIHWDCAEDDRSCTACVNRGNTWPISRGTPQEDRDVSELEVP